MSKETGKSTPRPWCLHPRVTPNPPHIYAGGGEMIVATVDTSCPEPGERDANAALIVRACNSFDALVEACDGQAARIIRLVEQSDIEGGYIEADPMLLLDVAKQLRAALALAGEVRQ